MTGAAWLHGKVKVGLPDGAELRCTSSVFEWEGKRVCRHVLAGIEAVGYVLSRGVL
jgi:hypothetical protein